ncbi:MAG TPA: glucuronate isomerase [Kiritimatiellia bacterium]|nr:glucuronate isomerase [Kiritimatiellia bacterium]
MLTDFLLTTPLARRLYHEYAAGLPIIDYHNHLSVRELAADHRFADLTEAWLTNDPYKHRAMRIAGVPEALITGAQGTPRERFDAWAAVVPNTLGNPLHLWTRLELARVFGITEPLNPESADRIWAQANERLRASEFSARGLLRRFNVRCACTSDGLLDDLSYHRKLAETEKAFRLLPSLRGDDVVTADPAWLMRLGATTGLTIDSLGAFRAAVRQRLHAFDLAGCRLADHALDSFSFDARMIGSADELFRRHVSGAALTDGETAALRAGILSFLGQEYGKRGWIMQLHLGAQRQTSTRLRRLAGPAGGYATIGDTCDTRSLCGFLDHLEQAGVLPRTICYTLNPADNAKLATLAGAFAEDGVAGKVQFGPAWWYSDHASGIRQHLEALANHGLLATFIGMTTDARSPLSFVRHEFFRRVLCDMLGEWAARDWVPNDAALLGGMVRAVSCDNARAMVMGETGA